VNMPRIFVSYSRKDRDITQRLVADLHRAGAEVWVDVDGITSGNFMQAIDEALVHCDWMVLVLSPHALDSKAVVQEVYSALRRVQQGFMKAVVPVLVAPCDPGSIPPQWDVLQRYDAIQSYDVALAGVLRAIGLSASGTSLPGQPIVPASNQVTEQLIKTILAYGEQYRQEHLVSQYQTDSLLKDWWKAFEFFLARACFQGRSDEASQRVYDAAVEVLGAYVSPGGDYLTDAQVTEVHNALHAKIGPGKAGKGRDVEMIMSALQFVSRLPQANMVAYSVKSITTGNVQAHYNELQWSQNHETGIVQVGLMVAAFYLRDVVTLYQLETYVPQAFQFCLEPIDVSLRKFAFHYHLVETQTASDVVIQQAIVQLCQEYRCSPFQFNQGVWYANATGSSL
jgi:hypothetical protein